MEAGSPRLPPHFGPNWPPIYIGKESDRHWEEGEDLRLLEFRPSSIGGEGMLLRMTNNWRGSRKSPSGNSCAKGINQPTLQNICNKKPARAIKLANCLKVLEQQQLEQ